MSVIEKVNPVVIDSIEFYVSSNGLESGMSISGLARFIGMSESKLRHSIVNKLAKPFAEKERENQLSSVPEILEHFVGKVFSDEYTSPQNAKIIKSKVCEAIIFYVAFESALDNNTKDIAKQSYRKFAQYGLHEFIKKASNYIEQNDESSLVAELRKLITESITLNQFAKEYKTIRETTTTYLPGCNDLLDDMVNNKLLETTETGAISIEGWLALNGIILTPTKFRQLAHLAAANYKSLVKSDPEKAHFIDAEGKKKYNVYVYKPEHYGLLQIAFQSVFKNK